MRTIEKYINILREQKRQLDEFIERVEYSTLPQGIIGVIVNDTEEELRRARFKEAHLIDTLQMRATR